MNNDNDVQLEDFRKDLARRNLGTPPMLDDRDYCTFCGNHAGFHQLADGYAWDVSRQLRDAHRNDFGTGGYYSDEA